MKVSKETYKGMQIETRKQASGYLSCSYGRDSAEPVNISTADTEIRSVSLMRTIIDKNGLYNKEPEVNTKPEVTTSKITTCMGKATWGDLPFLTNERFDEFNVIGYTGKNSKGEKTSKSSYLRSVDEKTLSLRQTKGDNGNFSEEFILTRIK